MVKRDGRQLERLQVSDPATQQFIDMAARAIRNLLQLDNMPYGIPTAIFKKDCKASFGDFLRVDPSEAALTVTLPKATKKDVGKTITVANISSSANTITIKPGGKSKINGADTWTTAVQYRVRRFIVANKDEWLWGNDPGVA